MMTNQAPWTATAPRSCASSRRGRGYNLAAADPPEVDGSACALHAIATLAFDTPTGRCAFDLFATGQGHDATRFRPNWHRSRRRSTAAARDGPDAGEQRHDVDEPSGRGCPHGGGVKGGVVCSRLLPPC